MHVCVHQTDSAGATYALGAEMSVVWWFIIVYKQNFTANESLL